GRHSKRIRIYGSTERARCKGSRPICNPIAQATNEPPLVLKTMRRLGSSNRHAKRREFVHKLPPNSERVLKCRSANPQPDELPCGLSDSAPDILQGVDLFSRYLCSGGEVT